MLEPELERARDELLRTLRDAVTDPRVYDALAGTPRELFVAPHTRSRAYVDAPLAIGFDQTISQPTMVAQMTELLELAGDDAVLDIGCGCGYHAAVMARLCAHVHGVERVPQLCATARRNLAAAGVLNVTVECADGLHGDTLFDAINVAAAAPVRVPPELERRLAPGGRMVVPVAGRAGQRLIFVRRTPCGIRHSTLGPVRFVPLNV